MPKLRPQIAAEANRDRPLSGGCACLDYLLANHEFCGAAPNQRYACRLNKPFDKDGEPQASAIGVK